MKQRGVLVTKSSDPQETGAIYEATSVARWLRDEVLPAHAWVEVHARDAKELEAALKAEGVEFHRSAVTYRYMRKA
jgi:hypothetical protein